MKTETIRARIDPVLKLEAEEIMETLGLTPSSVIKMLYKQIVLTRALPFPVRLPNAATLAAMAELEHGGGGQASSVADMLRDLKSPEADDDACTGPSDGPASSRRIIG